MNRLETLPVAVLGGTGYVSGELLRLLSGHPVLRVVSVASTSQAGGEVVAAFPHLAGAVPADLRFASLDDLLDAVGSGAVRGVFAATPHGATAALVDAVLSRAEAAGVDVHVVDLSADFRYRDPAAWEAVYGKPHGAPARTTAFVATVPELYRGPVPTHAAQPGCFTTAVTLAAAPFVAAGLVDGPIFASAVTGSSGSGRTPGPGTHHPERRSTLYAYNALQHRHEPEMRALLGGLAGGGGVEVEFVPHSGPFTRGIHATVRVPLRDAMSARDALEVARAFYQGAPFVAASATLPRLSDVVGTNRCALGVAARGRTVVVTSVIDNLVKGAAGGAVQWMNRVLGLPEDAGLRLPGLGWF